MTATSVELLVQGHPTDVFSDVLTEESLAFVALLHRRFAARIRGLLQRREELQRERVEGVRAWGFLPETLAVRAGDWSVAKAPVALEDRRVEITGPVDRKMIINALNSGARVFMADFEDSNTPSWDNLMHGQRNLADAVRETITLTAQDTGKRYRLNDSHATLMVRPRGLHLPERHLRIDGEIAVGALVDFGLFFFHNAREQLARGVGPYFYLPKLESHLEARLWNDVFVAAQDALSIPRGTIKATVLIETLPAAFEMDEILYELREHSAGLNCGRWDYIFSFIKRRAHEKAAITPDRALVTMDRAFLRAYSLLLIQTCHRRGAHAMGGMAAVIPIKSDPEANARALDRVRADKLREVRDGHDGTWVAHPGLVPIAQEIFDTHMPAKNQLERLRPDVRCSVEDLLEVHDGVRTLAGLRANIRVGILYLEAWLRGVGCVPIDHLMEDAATAEISRAQVWQQLRYRLVLDGLGPLERESYTRIVDEELSKIAAEVSEEGFARGRFAEARALFDQLVMAPHFEEFLTLRAYETLRETLND
ncbi:MAG: malate synthase A [Deltaproteobacteria bacterium]|nr:malate synthase A [Deltaproteobacteria bacterium]